MSELARKMAGTFIPEEKRPPLLEWLQEELRFGSLRNYVEDFVRQQPEALDASRLLVDSVNVAGIRCRIPRFVADHESSRPMREDIEFELSPPQWRARRF